MKLRSVGLAIAASILSVCAASSSRAQEVADPGFKSVGRGAPLALALRAPAREAVPAGTPAAELDRVKDQMRAYPFVGPMRIVRRLTSSGHKVDLGPEPDQHPSKPHCFDTLGWDLLRSTPKNRIRVLILCSCQGFSLDLKERCGGVEIWYG